MGRLVNRIAHAVQERVVFWYLAYHQARAKELTVRQYLVFMLTSRGIPTEKATLIVNEVINDIRETQRVWYLDDLWKEQNFCIASMLISQLVNVVHWYVNEMRDKEMYVIAQTYFPSYIFNIMRWPSSYIKAANVPVVS